MTTYTFNFPKKSNIKSNKDILADKILNAYPWLSGEKEEKETLDIYLIDSISCPIGKKSTLLTLDDLENEFFTFARNYSSLAKDYDFEDEFGTPIRIFDNFVQIGYEVIPIVPGSLNHLKPKTKKTIIDITIKLKNFGLI